MNRLLPRRPAPSQEEHERAFHLNGPHLHLYEIAEHAVHGHRAGVANDFTQDWSHACLPPISVHRPRSGATVLSDGR